MTKNILCIVEGASYEPKFVENVFSKVIGLSVEIYSYKTNIHVLSSTIKRLYPEFEDDDLDITGILTEIYGENEVLKRKYTDIFMIFDFDPQDTAADFLFLHKMLDYFCDSTDHGKLFINYPMMESLKHVSFLGEEDYVERKFPISDLRDYCKTVGTFLKFQDIRKYDRRIYLGLLKLNLIKCNNMLSGMSVLPSFSDYSVWNGSSILEAELKCVEDESQILVLNTSLFIISDYNWQMVWRRIGES